MPVCSVLACENRTYRSSPATSYHSWKMFLYQVVHHPQCNIVKLPASLPTIFRSRKIQLSEAKEHDYTDTPRKKKLKLMLERKRVLSETRLKKLRAARQANRRLVKKNAELSDVIAELRLNFKF
uniref:Uncharacterized protein n=1 Tax=Pectinophora gossypiella TaxID=13191 RepID=A0A1E1WPW6_PECGO